MKAITLTQPWATLVAIGAKRIETRSWKTDYRGPLAIHAAKGWTYDVVDMTLHAEPFHSELKAAGYPLFSMLPRACVVAVCELVSVCQIPARSDQHGWEWDGPDGTAYSFKIDDQERAFGDYTPGRWAWLLANVQRFVVPMSARGALGLWNWDGAQ